jgi:mannose-6-phosphate isomerase class I
VGKAQPARGLTGLRAHALDNMIQQPGLAKPVRPYIANPCYSPVGGVVASGWDDLAATLEVGTTVLAIDGPVVAGWVGLRQGLGQALERRQQQAGFIWTGDWLLSWSRFEQLTSSPELRDDPDFECLFSGRLADLAQIPENLDVSPGEVLVVYGPGAALAGHSTLWYTDLPKRYAEAVMSGGEGLNLGQRSGDGPGTTRRLFFVDWPLLDRHREEYLPSIDMWVDMQDASAPKFVDGVTLRGTLADLAHRPFRTRPTFNTTTWGGHWGQEFLGHNADAPNTGVGYELIAPEAGVLIGNEGGPWVEVPFQLVVATHPEPVLGADVYHRFGSSFPVRFDYLDTLGGGNLSVHCHPKPDYMRTVFGWPYPQHESYYVMVGGEGHEIFLGLRQDADIEAFRRDASTAEDDGTPLEISEYVPPWPAAPHQLFLIPAGTPHGSGKGNVVLEISATPYLYSLRFYDWLRRDTEGGLRPVHVAHAFRNLNADRRGDAIEKELIPKPRLLRQGHEWHEELIGRLPEMFFEVRRVVLQPGSTCLTWSRATESSSKYPAGVVTPSFTPKPSLSPPPLAAILCGHWAMSLSGSSKPWWADERPHTFP